MLCIYYCLYDIIRRNHVIISSEPLSAGSDQWFVLVLLRSPDPSTYHRPNATPFPVPTLQQQLWRSYWLSHKQSIRNLAAVQNLLNVPTHSRWTWPDGYTFTSVDACALTLESRYPARYACIAQARNNEYFIEIVELSSLPLDSFSSSVMFLFNPWRQSLEHSFISIR